MRLPVVIATSVVRSTHQGDSHGGIYLIDLETGEWALKYDLNNPDIDWAGRGGDRGFRGIAFHDGKTIAAAADELFWFDKEFNIVERRKNHLLGCCHDIYVYNKILYCASTMYNSIVRFNFDSNDWCEKMWWCGADEVKSFLMAVPPAREDAMHLNTVWAEGNVLGEGVLGGDYVYYSGTNTTCLRRLHPRTKETKAMFLLPRGTHDVQRYGESMWIYNDTDHNQVVLADLFGHKIECFVVPEYNNSEMINTDIPHDHARQAFARGLCLYGDVIIGGSSPATISVYKRGEEKPIRKVRLSRDMRCAIHGLEVYPWVN